MNAKDPFAIQAVEARIRRENEEAAYQAHWERYRKLREELMNSADKSRTQSPTPEKPEPADD